MARRHPQEECIACGGETFRVEGGLYDTRFGTSGTYEVGRCVECGVEQTLPRFSWRKLKSLYAMYYNAGDDETGWYARLREKFFSSPVYGLWTSLDGDICFHRLKGRGRLLDAGCNEGRNLPFYRRSGFRAEGLEPNPGAAARARKRGFRIHERSMEEFRRRRACDAVSLCNVLEHSPAPRKLLGACLRALEPGGRLLVSCPNASSWLRRLFGRYWINWHVPFHTLHFEERTLTRLLEAQGFRVVSVSNETPALWVVHSLIAWLFFRRGRPTRQLRNAWLVAGLLILTRLILFPVLSLGNRLGGGDCLKVVAIRNGISFQFTDRGCSL